MAEINSLSFYTQGLVGYILKLEFLQEKPSLKLKLDKRQKNSNFQFKIDPGNLIYRGECLDEQLLSEIRITDSRNQIPETSNRFDNDILYSHISNEVRFIFDSKDSKRNDFLGEKALPKISNYAEGIKTLRLFNGKPLSLEEFVIEEDEEEKEEEERLSVFKDQDEEEEEELNENVFNLSRKEINFVVANPAKPKIIQILQILTNSLFLFIFVLGYVVYFLNFSQNDVLNVQMMTLRNSNLRLSEFEHILNRINELYFMKIGIYSSKENITENSIRSQLLLYLESLEALQLFLNQNSNDISSDFQHLLTDQSINMIFSRNSSEKFGLNEATQQMISKIFNLINSDLASIDFDNSNFLFLNLNIYGEFFEGLLQANEHYYSDLFEKIEVGQSNLVVMLLSGTGLLGGCIALMLISIKIQKISEQTLSMFLSIKEEDLRNLYGKNESFLSFLQTGDDQDEDFYENDEEDDQKVEEYETNKLKKRKFKKKRKTPYKLIGTLFFISAFLEFFFLFVYFSAYSLSKDLEPIVDFLRLANDAETEFLYSFNCQQSLLVNDQFLQGNTSLQGKCQTSIGNVHEFQRELNDV